MIQRIIVAVVLSSHYSSGAVGAREKFHEEDQGILMLRKEKYQDEQNRG